MTTISWSYSSTSTWSLSWPLSHLNEIQKMQKTIHSSVHGCPSVNCNRIVSMMEHSTPYSYAILGPINPFVFNHTFTIVKLSKKCCDKKMEKKRPKIIKLNNSNRNWRSCDIIYWNPVRMYAVWQCHFVYFDVDAMIYISCIIIR